MNKQISSVQNPYIKQLIQLKDKSRERKKSGLFLIEGEREIMLALKGGYELETLLINPEIMSLERLNNLTIQRFNDSTTKELNTIEITSDVYEKLAYRDTTEGVLAVAKSKVHDIGALTFKTENPLILVAEAPEKPGNIGALLRTADAARVDAVIIANPKTDLYNPNIIRSSVGCVFTNTIVTGSTSDIIGFLKSKNILIYCAALQASVNYDT